MLYKLLFSKKDFFLARIIFVNVSVQIMRHIKRGRGQRAVFRFSLEEFPYSPVHTQWNTCRSLKTTCRLTINKWNVISNSRYTKSSFWTETMGHPEDEDEDRNHFTKASIRKKTCLKFVSDGIIGGLENAFYK